MDWSIKYSYPQLWTATDSLKACSCKTLKHKNETGWGQGLVSCFSKRSQNHFQDNRRGKKDPQKQAHVVSDSAVQKCTLTREAETVLSSG